MEYAEGAVYAGLDVGGGQFEMLGNCGLFRVWRNTYADV